MRATTARLSKAATALGCAGFAVLALASGLDRQSRGDSASADAVPGFLASQTLRSAGRLAIARGDAKQGAELGRRAVAEAPVDPESSALLGAALSAGGDRAGADRAFRVAGQLGWRVPYTQLYWMNRALGSGDYQVAALRLDALLRQQPALLARTDLLGPMETDPRGRFALAERMRLGPGWLPAYSDQVRTAPREVLLRRAAVLMELSRQGGTVGCASIAPLAEHLVASNAIADADRVWRAHCPSARDGLIYDGTFAEAAQDQQRSQFAWTFIGQSDVTALLEPAGSPPTQRLVLESSSARTRLVVRQLVLAAPGTYRISWQADTPQGTPSDLIAVSFSCTPDPADWLGGRFDAAAARWSTEVRIGSDCEAHWLGFAVQGRGGTARLGAIRLDRVG